MTYRSNYESDDYCNRFEGGARDLGSIADMGLGVLQTLPVVVALLAAQPGQLVYIEQPEIQLQRALRPTRSASSGTR
jgi:predicted ATPase